MERSGNRREGERALIERLRARSGRSRAVKLGIGDDCALLRIPPGAELAVTTDFSLEGVHFRRDWHTPEAAGHRCLARGLSDLAAMGARPLAAFLSLAAPAELMRSKRGTKSWVERFFDGLLALAGEHGVTLAGGDTAQAPARNGGMVAADIVLLGAVRAGNALLRSGARAGDVIYVTGALGGAAAELLELERSPAKFKRLREAVAGHPHLFPEPRLKVGQRLADHGWATAAIDVSDGLSTDLDHLCEESGLAAEVEIAAIPVHARARSAEAQGWADSALALALHGGEDYELLFTASPEMRIPRRIAGVAVHAIGHMKAQRRGPRMTRIDLNGGRTELKAEGWEHFR